MKKILRIPLAVLALFAAPLQADEYRIDPSHSFVTFTISHLGYSVLHGRFNTLNGAFDHDPAAPEKSRIHVEVATASVDTNHAERDKHLRGGDFLAVDTFPTATFESSAVTMRGESGTLKGKLTLHGVTRDVTMPITHVGAGKDPWGGYRSGWSGRLTIKRSDYGISYNLGPAAAEMTLGLFIEGIRK